MLNYSFSTDVNNVHSLSKIEKNISSFKRADQNILEKAAREFESLLIYEMLKTMNKNISFEDNEQENFMDEDAILIKKNQAEKIFTDFLTYERGKIAVESNTINLGLADTIVKQINHSN